MLLTCTILKVVSGMILFILLFNITDVQTRALHELTSQPKLEYLVDTFTTSSTDTIIIGTDSGNKELTAYMNNKTHHGWILHAPISQIVSNLAFEKRPLPVSQTYLFKRPL